MIFFKLKHIPFFYKLFFAFLITGIIPIALISTVFAFLSGNIMKGSYRQQSRIAVERVAEDLSDQLDKYRHTVYEISRDPELISDLQENRHPGRPDLLKLYQRLYKALTGNIDNASIHIISLTAFPSLSTQQIPELYTSDRRDATGSVFDLAGRDPQKTVSLFNSFTNDRGDRVMMTFCRTIQDDRGRIIGYVILDINKNHIAEICEKANKDFFTQLLIVDPLNNLVSDLNHNENDGNFSRLPYLSRIPSGTGGQYTEGERMIVYQPLSLSPFQAAGSVPMNVILSNLAYLVRITLLMILFSIALAVLLAYKVSRSISRPVHELTMAMGEVEAGDLSVRIQSERDDEIGLLLKRFNIMTDRIADLVEETKEEQEQLRVAERKALQAQINPHFLYNTLNTIKSIAKLEGVDKITAIVTRLGKLLRNTIENDREITTLRDSVELVENYLAIQKIRYGERLSYEIDVPEDLSDLLIPKLILQPIVENAVIHGLEGKIDRGTIRLTARSSYSRLVIGISDDGMGMAVPWSPESRREGAGVGLANVHRRLNLLYGADSGLKVESRSGSGTTVTVSLPELKEGSQ